MCRVIEVETVLGILIVTLHVDNVQSRNQVRTEVDSSQRAGPFSVGRIFITLIIRESEVMELIPRPSLPVSQPAINLVGFPIHGEATALPSNSSHLQPPHSTKNWRLNI